MINRGIEFKLIKRNPYDLFRLMGRNGRGHWALACTCASRSEAYERASFFGGKIIAEDINEQLAANLEDQITLFEVIGG